MSVARVTEISSTSTVSFDDAIKEAVNRASKTLQGVKGAWISDQSIVIDNGRITEYQVKMKVTFVLND